jgi:hypothetical protein
VNYNGGVHWWWWCGGEVGRRDDVIVMNDSGGGGGTGAETIFDRETEETDGAKVNGPAYTAAEDREEKREQRADTSNRAERNW